MPYKDKKQQRAANLRWLNKRKGETKAVALAAKSAGCFFCGEKEPACLDFHHLNPDEKDFKVSASYGMTTEEIIAEVAKCVVLCANCHRKLHAGLLHFQHGVAE